MATSDNTDILVHLGQDLRILLAIHENMALIDMGDEGYYKLTDAAGELAGAVQSLLIHRDLYRFMLDVYHIGATYGEPGGEE